MEVVGGRTEVSSERWGTYQHGGPKKVRMKQVAETWLSWLEAWNLPVFILVYKGCSAVGQERELPLISSVSKGRPILFYFFYTLFGGGQTNFNYFSVLTNLILARGSIILFIFMGFSDVSTEFRGLAQVSSM